MAEHRGRDLSARFFQRLLIVVVLIAFSSLAQAAPSEEIILAASPPKLLSEYGFFDDLRAQKPADAVTPFDIATPLYSDGAVKRRFVYLPAGKPTAYSPDEAFAFPVGAALIKTFAFPADYRAPEQNIRLVETRVLLRHRVRLAGMGLCLERGPDRCRVEDCGRQGGYLNS